MTTGDDVLWQPQEAALRDTALWRFATQAAARAGAPAPNGSPAADYAALWQWSVDEPAAFWDALRRFADLVGDFDGAVTLQDGQRMPGARWFAGAQLNYAENLLQAADEALALHATNETGQTRRLNFGELRDQVAAVAAGLRAAGIGPGDVVAGYLPNIPEAVVAMLATTSLGAAWTSTSPDFGLEGVVDRFGQVRPRVLFTVDGYGYAGKTFDCLGVVGQLPARLPGLERVVVIPRLAQAPADLTALPLAVHWQHFGVAGQALHFERVAFDAPLFILYSSGTTGRPKCIVHGVGGTLLQHAKEHRLHADLGPGDALFFYTTCGWMMWNWLVSGLATGASVVLFDGSPVHPEAGVLWHLADEAGVTHFGTSPRYLASLEKSGHVPRQHHALTRLRSVLSTGSPLSPALFDYVYTHIKPEQQLASISGGTDIISCFCLGVPWLPVRAGQIQGPGLGMDVQVWNEHGNRLQGEAGELVCTRPFPSMPVGFWNDADGQRYRAAYFERFPGVWHHGDRVVETAEGGFVFLGRSDAVLNPGGVRIGTAEIYRQLDAFAEIAEAVAVGQQVRDAAGLVDERIVLFLRLHDAAVADAALQERIRRRLRENASPRHVPARIVVVPDIPRTRSGKTVELAVKHMVNGQPVDNVEALANPEALRHFHDRPELRD